MANDVILHRQDLITNPNPRLPICLVLDASGSMSEVVANAGKSTGQTVLKDHQTWNIVEGGITKLDLLNEGVKLFFSELKMDVTAKYTAEVALIAFASDPLKLMDFDSLERVKYVEIKEMDQGGTNIGDAVRVAIDLLNLRKKEYSDCGVDYFQPWLVIMTDGRPTNTSHICVSQEVADLVQKRKLSVFPIGVGDDADMNVLAMFSPRRSPLKLKGLCFKEFFQWLSKSVTSTSRSNPGEEISLDPPTGWGVVY